MKNRLLPETPRTVQPRLRRVLWWGSPLMTFSALTTFLVVFAALFLFVLYGVPARALWSSSGEQVRVTSQVSRKETKTLPGGDRVGVVWAPVRVNETVIEARGYGPETDRLEIGDPVEIVIPESDPRAAWLEGFQPYPVQPRVLLTTAGLFLLPALLVALWSLFRTRRTIALLTRGVECRGSRLRTIPLPRPLKDKALVRWEFSSPQGEGRFWTLQSAEEKKPVLLVADGKAAVLPNLLPHPVLDDGTVGSDAFLPRFCLGLNTTLAALCGLAVLSFIFL
ncbi:MAG: hypothetical protein WC314_24710 [Vulcanimicrobiota bacterium]